VQGARWVSTRIIDTLDWTWTDGVTMGFCSAFQASDNRRTTRLCVHKPLTSEHHTGFVKYDLTLYLRYNTITNQPGLQIQSPKYS
jgi:hypothetical protein